MRSVAFLAMFAFATACQPGAAPQSVAAPPVDRETLAFVQAACGDCHAVENSALSPNPLAPEWPRIANQRGLTAQTLRRWLLDAHNYPEEMDFDIDGPDVDRIAAYMLTLQREGYEPPIQ